MTRGQMRREVTARVRAMKRNGYGHGLRAFAVSIGWPANSATHISRFLAGGKPSDNLLRALGYRRVDDERYEVHR